jgi:hypothetical protein
MINDHPGLYHTGIWIGAGSYKAYSKTITNSFECNDSGIGKCFFNFWEDKISKDLVIGKIMGIHTIGFYLPNVLFQNEVS